MKKANERTSNGAAEKGMRGDGPHVLGETQRAFTQRGNIVSKKDAAIKARSRNVFRKGKTTCML